MNAPNRFLAVGLAAVLASNLALAEETIVMIRHAEKPDAGLGQLSCQGLNRALALPKVLLGKFATPASVFAPNPGVKKDDLGESYNYIRPLATIEPTAIQLGIPVNTSIGFENVISLEAALLAPRYKDATVFVSWEHRLVERAARNLVKQFGGDPSAVPVWDGYDFDSIYVVTLATDSHGKRSAKFRVEKEGLNGQPTSCPGS